MTPTNIKIMLLQRGLTISGIARDRKIPRSLVSMVVHGKKRTPYVRRAIAEELGIPYLILWEEPDPGVDRLTPGVKKSVTSVSESMENGGK